MVMIELLRLEAQTQAHADELRAFPGPRSTNASENW
jgi:hypothetical protein